MGQTIRIESLELEELQPYTDRREVLLKDFPGYEHGLFIAESIKVIERALASGAAPVSMMVEESWLPKVEELYQRLCGVTPEAPLLVASAETFKAITGFQIVRAPIAAFQRKPLPSAEELLSNAKSVAILEDITNYTNIGAIFRSAAALGVDAVLVTPACHDPLYRRADRVSMGTVHQVPWGRIGQNREWAAEGIPLLHKMGFKVAAMALSDDSVPLGDASVAAEEKLALVLGTEGEGLSETTIQLCDYVVRIPMDNEVDSLNVAAASAVAFWELVKRPQVVGRS